MLPECFIRLKGAGHRSSPDRRFTWWKRRIRIRWPDCHRTSPKTEPPLTRVVTLFRCHSRESCVSICTDGGRRKVDDHSAHTMTTAVRGHSDSRRNGSARDLAEAPRIVYGMPADRPAGAVRWPQPGRRKLDRSCLNSCGCSIAGTCPHRPNTCSRTSGRCSSRGRAAVPSGVSRS